MDNFVTIWFELAQGEFLLNSLNYLRLYSSGYSFSYFIQFQISFLFLSFDYSNLQFLEFQYCDFAYSPLQLLIHSIFLIRKKRCTTFHVSVSHKCYHWYNDGLLAAIFYRQNSWFYCSSEVPEYIPFFSV